MSFLWFPGRSYRQLRLVRYLDTLKKPAPWLKGKNSLVPDGSQWEGNQGQGQRCLSSGYSVGWTLRVGSKARLPCRRSTPVRTAATSPAS